AIRLYSVAFSFGVSPALVGNRGGKMARPRRDGTPARECNRRKLTDLFVSSRKAQERPELIWDLKQPGLALSVRPSSKKAWKVIYRFHRRPRWLPLRGSRALGPRHC